jgi:hypothetical protein
MKVPTCLAYVSDGSIVAKGMAHAVAPLLNFLNGILKETKGNNTLVDA